MSYPGTLDINDYTYSLPPERIAQFPLEHRDQSKLLVYKNGQISHDQFFNIPQYLPDESLLIFNETKVVQARINFQKETGAGIEIFCLEPIHPTREIQQAFHSKASCTWKCLVGNSRKWKHGNLQLSIQTADQKIILEVRRIEQFQGTSSIRFSWHPEGLTFAEVLEEAGHIPLPPYIHRNPVESDKVRYQTVYAKNDGSVAAPTAGLHFTQDIMEKIRHKNIKTEKVTLHIGAATFKPVTSKRLDMHVMHTEQVIIPTCTIRSILDFSDQHITLVGTTTVRTIESLYWQGVKWMKDDPENGHLNIRQWDPYKLMEGNSISVQESLTKVLGVLDKYEKDALSGTTQLLIAPGFKYTIPDAMITNFHMPQSTLLLLVAAFIGDDWRRSYQYAMDNEFRFLSYGDSCLFFKNP